MSQRSPLASTTFDPLDVSLADPPRGFLRKFLLFKAVVETGAGEPGLLLVIARRFWALLISMYYYFGLIRHLLRGCNGFVSNPDFSGRLALYAACCGSFTWTVSDALVKIFDRSGVWP